MPTNTTVKDLFVSPVFPKLVCSRGHFWLRKITNGYAHPCSRKYSLQMTVSKTENLYLRTDFREIYTSSICNNALYDMILMKVIVARFVGTAGFLIKF